MDVDEVYLDLLALRALYILLLKSCWRDANSELLDERAQILLKNLLDDATAGVLELHSKILATDSGFFNNFRHKEGSSFLTGIDDKQTKPLDKKVAEWMEHNQSARKMGNLETEDNPRMARSSALNIATNHLSNGISLALRRIELHILSLQRCTSQSRRNTRSHINGAKLANYLQGNEILSQQKVQSRTDHSTLKARITKPIRGHNLRSHIRSHLLGGQNVKAVVRGVESLTRACQMNHCSEFVHGFRIPLSQDNDEARKPPTVETQISKEHKLINPMILIDKSGCSVGSKATVRSGRKLLNQTRIQERRCQNSPGRMIMRPTLLDHISRGVEREKENHKKTHVATQQESENTNSESESTSSSSWATQPTSESETTDYPSSPTHQKGPPATGSEASSRYRSSSISTKTFRFSHGQKGSKKAIGRFKRLKNKLGLIFHHHHHHHHHHNHHHHNTNTFMWKHLRKIFHLHRTDNKKLTSEGGYGKLKKSAIRSVSRKNQVGKFQALAEGLRSHVWKSKAMKKKELRRLSGGRKKGVKKLQWWQMFRRRRGVKLPKKGRVKIGYVNRKPQLKVV